MPKLKLKAILNETLIFFNTPAQFPLIYHTVAVTTRQSASEEFPCSFFER